MITIYHTMRNIRRYRLYGGCLIPLAVQRERIGAGRFTEWINI